MWGCLGENNNKHTCFDPSHSARMSFWRKFKNEKSKKKNPHTSRRLGLEKSEEIFSPTFPPCSSTSRIHNSIPHCRQRSNATRKIENENHLLATPFAHPPFEQHRVSLVEAIYYRDMASGLANTYTRRWKFIVICVVFPYVQISLPSFSSPSEKPKKICLLWLLFFLLIPPDHRESVPSHRRAFGSAVQRMCMYNNNASGYDEAK
jgi:hypothetical protein